ncbi:putative sodium-coupled neutral amino acid transporter 10 isoform X2 [Narcine bancroftii]|uniref:putative sodium-coupled neutral amino acid transporter 10 isoform X2 n=1 Tax=Narcine bancroftii TaxID=1343680 RepID=UPI003831A27F
MTASNWGLIMNVVNSIVGVSVLTMPFCFKQCGIALGVLLLLFCSWMTHQSCMFLVKAANASKRRTYAGLAFLAYGKAGKMVVETSLIGLMLGTCIAFYVVIADLGSNFFAQLLGLQVTQGFRVFLLFAVSVFIVLPLSLQRNMMASIQSFSAMALIFYTLFMFVIVLSSFKHGLFSGQWLRRVSYIRWDGFFRCIPIYGMSFACQSQVLPTYDILDEPSVKRMSSIFSSALNVVNTFYVTIGSFGYISYTDSIAGNVMMNFPSNLVTEMIRVGFMMSVAVGFPMMILPCRQALNTFLFEQLQQKDGTFTAGGYMPPLRFKLITAAIVFGTMFGGILIPNVETILGLTGATMGSLICFICPALIYRKIQKDGFAAQIILWIGLIILVISTFSTLTAPSDRLAIPEKPPQDINHEKLQNDINMQQKISAQNIVVKEASDDRDRPKLEKEVAEQPQIKVPIEPQEDRNDKGEEVQLDRPDQGFAHPVGEAHRHEPPNPHDEVVVDEGMDGDDSNEKKGPIMKAEQENGIKEEAKLSIKEEGGKESNEEPKINPRGKEQGEKIGNDINNPGNAPEVKSELKEQPAKMEVEVNANGAVPQAGMEIHSQKMDKHGKIPRKDDSVIHNQEGGVEHMNNKDLENGNKKDLPSLEKIDVAGESQLRIREGRDSENANVERKQDGEVAEGEEKRVDHEVLLNVIKEQQEQQKRLLDQQEKLLAVIQEQHKEIHQQKSDDEDKGQLGNENAVKQKMDQGSEDQVKHIEAVNEQKAEKLHVINADLHGVSKLDQDLQAADRRKDNAEPKNVLLNTQLNSRENQDQVYNAKQDARMVVEAHRIAPQPRDGMKKIDQNGGAPELPLKSKDNEKMMPPDDAEVPKSFKQIGILEAGVKAAREHGPRNPNVPLENGVRAQRKEAEVGIQNLKFPDSRAKDFKFSDSLNAEAKSRNEIHDVEPKPLIENPEHVENEEVGVGAKDVFENDHPIGHQEDRKENIEQPVNPAKIQKEKEENLDNRAQELDKRKVEDDLLKSHQKASDDQVQPHPNVVPQHKEKNPSQKNGEPYKDLKVDDGGDLRRKKRDLNSQMDESQHDNGDKLIINLDPVPNFKTDDLRSALEVQLNQAAGGPFQIVQSRKMKQMASSEDNT